MSVVLRQFRRTSALELNRVAFFTVAVYILFTPSGKSRPSAVLARVSGFSLSESTLTDKLSFSPLLLVIFNTFFASLAHFLSRPGCADEEGNETDAKVSRMAELQSRRQGGNGQIERQPHTHTLAGLS